MYHHDYNTIYFPCVYILYLETDLYLNTKKSVMC